MTSPVMWVYSKPNEYGGQQVGTPDSPVNRMDALDVPTPGMMRALRTVPDDTTFRKVRSDALKGAAAASLKAARSTARVIDTLRSGYDDRALSRIAADSIRSYYSGDKSIAHKHPPAVSDFGKAFRAARDTGQSEFSFGGKQYSTKLR